MRPNRWTRDDPEVPTPPADPRLAGGREREHPRGPPPRRPPAPPREPEPEARWFAFGIPRRTLPRDPERTWQLLRRAGRDADDWITVDTLAGAVGKGILAEPYRWAELEQLGFSPLRRERRPGGAG